jgi:hypothetical protein
MRAVFLDQIPTSPLGDQSERMRLPPWTRNCNGIKRSMASWSMSCSVASESTCFFWKILLQALVIGLISSMLSCTMIARWQSVRARRLRTAQHSTQGGPLYLPQRSVQRHKHAATCQATALKRPFVYCCTATFYGARAE